MNQPSQTAPEQTEEIKSAHATTMVHRLPGCRLKLEIKVSPQATEAAYHKAIKNISKEVSIPGFRKGRAPEALILKQFDKHVVREWHDLIANTAFQEFLQQTRLFPFTKDKSVKRVEVKNVSKEQGAEVLIEYEATPEIPKVDKSQIKIQPFQRRTVTAEDLVERIHNLQLQHADWSLVMDRPLQEGDFVDLDIMAIDLHPPRPICEEMRFEVAAGKMASWMRKLLIGRNRGEVVEGMSESEEGITQEAEFKPTLCQMTIKAIYTSTQPALDDAFAQKLRLKDVEELCSRIETDLNLHADAEVQDQHRAQVEEQLLALYQFDLPSSMIQDKKRQMVAEQLAHLQKGRTLSTPIEELKQEVETEVTQKLNRSYRLFFLCQAVVEEHHIEVSDKELVDEMVQQMMHSPEQALKFSKKGMQEMMKEMQSELYVNVMSRKALDFLAS